MNLQFHCSKCDELVSADSEFGGDIAQCPACDAQIMVPMDAVGTGMVVGNYKLLNKLGNGGMGDVYLAEQASLGRQVALKVLPPAMTRDEKIAERFLYEMRNQAALNHPNIATAYDAGNDRDIYYLAMEYVEGVDLSRILIKREKLPEREALRIALEVARGLDYAWYKKKIIHRDIKPGNIIVSRDAEVRILDMGLSRSMTEVVDLSGTQYLVGTPLYMSPEQVDSDVSLDFRTDMYSLGATLYHMLTGQTPYTGRTVTQILAQRATKDPKPVKQLNPDVSDGCAIVVDAMMARNRDERFSDWPAAIAAINQALGGNVPLSPSGLEAAQQEANDSALLEIGGNDQVVEKVAEKQPSAASAPVKNPMIPVYLSALGVAALALIAIIMGFAKMKPRYIEVPVEVAAIEPSVVSDLVGDGDVVGMVEPSVLQPVSSNVVAGPAPLSEEEATRLRKEQEDGRARDEVQALYDFSVENLLESPEDFDPHIEAFTQVMNEAARLEMFTLKEVAEEEIERLKKLKRERIESLLARLQEQATVAIDAGSYKEAVELVQSYDGPLVVETRNARKTLAASVSKKAENVRVKRRLELAAAKKAYAGLIDKLAEAVVSNRNVAVLQELIYHGKSDPVFEPVREDVYLVDGVINLLTDTEKNILFTFRAEIGKLIDVEFASEMKSLTIKSVDDEKVMASQLVEGEEVSGTIGFSFTPAELSLRERSRRIELAHGARAPFVQGFMALKAGREGVALDYFKRSDNDLTGDVVHLVSDLAQSKADEARELSRAALEREAKWAFANVLQSALLPTGNEGEEELLEKMALQIYDDDRLRVIALMTSSFQEKYGSTEFALRYGVLLNQLKGQTYKRVTLEKLKQQLKRVNPEYNGQGVFETNSFSVLKVDFDGAGDVHNLAPLKGLPLRALRLAGSEIENISALKEMPLRSLVLKGTAVEDLSALESAPLETLSLEDCPNVRDLSPLANARLRVINLQGTPVTDLSALEGQPLEQLLVGFNTRKLELLSDWPLNKLSLAGSKVSDLKPLSDSHLEVLDLFNTPVTDLSVLKTLPLKVLKFDPRKIKKGWDELRGMTTLTQFQIAVDKDPISSEAFWELVDDGVFADNGEEAAVGTVTN